MPGLIRLGFATSNAHKFMEASYVLAPFGVRLSRLGWKGTEIQSDDVEAIASHAAIEAQARYGRPLIVEDTGLWVEALGGFPGPYGSQAFRTIGVQGLLTLLGKNASRKAEFRSAVAYAEKGSEPKVFVGSLSGKISRRPRGTAGFGFDQVFIPHGSSRTLGEMSLGEKCSLSHRAVALSEAASWLKSRKSG